MTRETDDQGARARHAAEGGLGRAVSGPEAPELERELEALLAPGTRAEIASSLDAEAMPDGAQEAADWLVELAGAPRSGARGAAARRNWHLPGGSPRRDRGVPGTCSPRRSRARQATRVSPKPPRTVIVALGLHGVDLERAVDDALVAVHDPPDRVLVITDSLDLRPSGVPAWASSTCRHAVRPRHAWPPTTIPFSAGASR